MEHNLGIIGAVYKPVILRLCSVTSVSDIQSAFMFSKYQLHCSMSYMHCLLLIVSSSRSHGSGSEGFNLKGSSTDLNLHCFNLVYWKCINSLNLLWNQWLIMGPVRWSNPDYSTEFQALLSLWMPQLPELSAEKEWWQAWVHGSGCCGQGTRGRSEGASGTEWDRQSCSGPGLTTAWLQDLWHSKQETHHPSANSSVCLVWILL